MEISAERIARDFKQIAMFTQTPGHGRSCPTFSKQWQDACKYVTDELTKAGCQIRVEPSGNIRARPKSVTWEQPVWLSGSHIDSVPNGGDYDGVAGVVVPLEILRAAHAAGRTDLPLELVIFAEEEGTTFGSGMLGSLSWVGKLNAHDLEKFRNAGGETYLAAGKPCGVQPENLTTGRFHKEHFRGMIEVHIEQGPRMWKRDERIGIVNAIAGRRQWKLHIDGQANHAGSTPMGERRDSVACAAEVVLELEKLASRISDRTVITVGKFAPHPGAVNVIAGSVDMSIDFRDSNNDVLKKGELQIAELIDGIASRRGLHFRLHLKESLPAMPLDPKICDQLSRAAEKLGVANVAVTQSGALHDAAIMAEVLPTAMLFVASRDGISHNPAEHSRIEDFVTAARVVAAVVEQK